MEDDKLEEVHEDLLNWAEIIGVETNGIRPMRISGRGFGGESPLTRCSCRRLRGKKREASPGLMTWPVQSYRQVS